MSKEEEKPWVKTYAGGKPNYTTPEDETPPCKTDPRAPHGFDRNASHSADRYVCECEGWEPPKKEWVGLATEEARKFYESDLSREELIHKIDEFLQEKNGGS